MQQMVCGETRRKRKPVVEATKGVLARCAGDIATLNRRHGERMPGERSDV